MQRALITGSTGGIGREVAALLCARGWSLILVNRDEAKSVAQASDLAAQFPDVELQPLQADFMDLLSVRALCQKLVSDKVRLDALLSISGVLTSERRLSAQGFESHYAVNTLATYDLIRHAIPLLRRPEGEPAAMVVTMSSSTINRVKRVELDTIADPKEIGGLMGAYAHSKVALTAMGSAWAATLKKDNILIRSVDPGATMTPMIERGDGMPAPIRWMAPLLFAKPRTQAEKLLQTLSPMAFHGDSGGFYAQGRAKKPPALVLDRQFQERVMEKLERDSQVV